LFDIHNLLGKSLCRSSIVLALLVTGLFVQDKSSYAAESAPAVCPSLLNRTALRLQDDAPQRLCQYAGQVTLVVNTASYCGYTRQYEGLEALYRRYRARGFVVLGFPSNDFGQQEPDSAKKIADFCFNTYGVKFPMFAQTTVAGSGKNGFYAALEQATGKTPQWNFHKYLIAPDGRVVSSFASNVDPKNPKLIQALERLLP
jgi:glutathione peroxidase